MKNLIDYAYQDNGTEFRSALYGAIHDKVAAHIEAKKQEIASGYMGQQESVEDGLDESSEKPTSSHYTDPAGKKRTQKNDTFYPEYDKHAQGKPSKEKLARLGEEVEDLDDNAEKFAHYYGAKKKGYTVTISNSIRGIGGKVIPADGVVHARKIAKQHNAKPWNF